MALIADVVQRDASTLSLNLIVSGVELRGQLRAQDLRFKLGTEGGEITGAEMTVEGFEIRSGGLKVQARDFSGKGVRIAWGDAGLRIVATSLSGPSLSLAYSAGRVQIGAWSVEELSVHGGEVEVSRGALSDIKLALHFGQPERPAVQKKPDEVSSANEEALLPHRKIFDWRLLDGLLGEFNVDLEVDLTVPVIGRRRATHRFRVPIDAGAINYMDLEKDLSTLENSILDFAVRPDGTLVLERGIPLLPTRGRGKPILTWRLEREDLALAQKDRIRLAVFPHFEVARSEDAESETKAESSSSVALRSLVLSNMETRLSLEGSVQPFEAAIRALTVQQLSLLGQVQFHPEQEPQPGHLSGEVKGVEATLIELPLAAHALSFAKLNVGSIADLQGDFLGLWPTSIDCTCSDFSFQGLRWNNVIST